MTPEPVEAAEAGLRTLDPLGRCCSGGEVDDAGAHCAVVPAEARSMTPGPLGLLR
jgi:hypothetical protein